MSRTRWKLGLGITALMTASALLPSPAHAQAVADYTITVDPSARGAAIDDTMYGVFFEDITAPPTAACTPNSCRTGPSSTPPPTTARTPRSPPGRPTARPRCSTTRAG
ncbi:hypothetical protein STENM223S_04841 [Streptomyces tendae]